MPLGENVNGGARPIGSRNGAGGALDIAFGLKEVNPEQYRSVVIPLMALLGATTTSGSDTYRVPTTHNLIIEKILPHVSLVDLANEVATVVTGVTPSSIADRVVMKAMNTLADLKNVDREQKVIDNRSMPLSALLPAAGGGPIDFGKTPHVVPAGESIRADMRWAVTTTANEIAGNTQVGLILVGKLVRVAKS